MPMKAFLKACLAVACLGLGTGVLASPAIELKDGSRIEGEIRSLDNGVYTVVSPSLGTLHVAESNIAKIEYTSDASKPAESSGKPSTQNAALSGEIQNLQSSLAQDPATMQSIMSLQSDPQIQALLSDPAIVKAIQDGDYTSLLANPKIQALDSNEHLKQLLQTAH